MPQVPYNPVADVSPSGQGTPYFSDRGATPEAFGAGVGASIEHFGAQLDRTASTIESNVLATQQLKNEAEVNSATTADLLTSGKLTNDFRQLPGSQAQDGLNDHVKALKEEREKLRDSLSNPEAKRMFDQQTMHRFALDVVNSSNYAATQMKQHTIQTYADKDDATIQQAAKDSRLGVPGAQERARDTLIQSARDSGKLTGDSPEAIARKARDKLTRLTAATTSAKATYDPPAAQKILDDAVKAGTVDEGQVETIQHNIDMKGIQFYSARDAKEIVSDHIQQDPATFDRNPQGKMNEMLQAAKDKADALYPTDAAHPENVAKNDMYLKQLTSNIENSASTLKKAYTDQTNDNKRFLTDISNQNVPGTNRKPANPQEMNQINPQAGQIYIDTQKRDPNFDLTTKFKANAAEDKIVPESQLEDQRKLWRGKEPYQKATTDLDQLFLDGKIDKTTRDKMQTEKDQIVKGARVEFSVAPIMSAYGS